MTPSLEQRMQGQLAQLEARGRGHLQARQRRQSGDLALAWALPCAVVMPALWLLAHAWLVTTWPFVAVAAVLVPALVAGSVYAVARSRQRVDPDEALGVFEQQFGLKDRLTACAALLAAPRRDGFAQAALLEAAPWIEQALAWPLATPRQAWPDALRRRWPFLPVALLLVGAACWMQWRTGGTLPSEDPTSLTAAVGQAGEPTAPQSAPAAPAAQASAPMSVPTRPAGGERPSTEDGRAVMARADRENRTQVPSSTAEAGGTAAQVAPDASTRAQVGTARPSPAAAAMVAAAGADSPPQPSSLNRGAAREADPSPPQAPQRAEAATPGAGQDDAADQSATADARSQGQQEAPPQRGSQPPAADKPSKPSKDGQPQDNGRGKSGNDNQNDGKGSGDGENNGQRRGKEADTKSGRGFATLLLARPMRDQVLGQTNPGRVSSALQQGRPQGGPATEVQAQDRGSLATSAAVMPARPQTAQDRALLRDYFSREGESEAGTERAAPRDKPKATR